MGKSKASTHSQTGGTEETAVPIVGFDYAFMSDREGSKVNSEEEDKGDDEGDSIIRVLRGHDSMSISRAAIPVPQKGIAPDEYAVRESLRYLDFLGFQS